mgnify:CR=1 FL=1
MRKNSREFLLVDGYNIINAWPELIRDAREVNLETSRDRLIGVMSDYSAMTGVTVIVVFDAHQVARNSRTSYLVNGVEVVFTKEGETADHYIEKVVDAIGREEKVRVATSDWIEQQIVLGRGASRVSARELYQEVKNTTSTRRLLQENDKFEKETLGDRVDSKIWEVIEKHIDNSEH